MVQMGCFVAKGLECDDSRSWFQLLAEGADTFVEFFREADGAGVYYVCVFPPWRLQDVAFYDFNWRQFQFYTQSKCL